MFLDSKGRMLVARRQIQSGSAMNGSYPWGSFWFCNKWDMDGLSQARQIIKDKDRHQNQAHTGSCHRYTAFNFSQGRLTSSPKMTEERDPHVLLPMRAFLWLTM